MFRKRRGPWPASKAQTRAGEVEWPTMKDGKPPEDMKDWEVERLPNGMRILDRRTIAPPIYMRKGDTLTCEYHQTYRWHRIPAYTKRRKLAQYISEEDHTIDTVIILELDDGSMEALGLEYGLAGVFGTAKQG